MTYTLRYTSSRLEVWRYYWRLWRTRLWLIHAVLAVVLGALTVGDVTSPEGMRRLALQSCIVFAELVALSAILSQLLFKRAERTLVVTPEGWSSQIGSKTGTKSWSETNSAFEQDGCIVIPSKGGNALIVPPRAFPSESERQEFVRAVKEWQAYVG